MIGFFSSFLVLVCIFALLCTSFSAILDTYISKEIKEFKSCPKIAGPSLNITHTKDYESFTVCWRFLTTAYPHCPGIGAELMIVRELGKGGEGGWATRYGGNLLGYSIYQPISGMSEDGKQAGWLGFRFNETGNGDWKQVSWR